MKKSSPQEDERASRIIQLLQWEGLKQKDLAEAIDMDPQNLSRCIRSGKVSERTYRKIVKVFPEYRLDWFLGLDEYPTKAAYKKALLQNVKGFLLDRFDSADLFSQFLEKVGIETKRGQGIIPDSYTLEKGGKTATLSAAEYMRFEKRIYDFILFEWDHLDSDEAKADSMKKQKIVSEMFMEK